MASHYKHSSVRGVWALGIYKSSITYIKKLNWTKKLEQYYIWVFCLFPEQLKSFKNKELWLNKYFCWKPLFESLKQTLKKSLISDRFLSKITKTWLIILKFVDASTEHTQITICEDSGGNSLWVYEANSEKRIDFLKS